MHVCKQTAAHTIRQYLFKVMEQPFKRNSPLMVSLLGGMSGQPSHLIKGVSSMEDDGWQEQIEKDLGIKGLL